MRKGRRGKQLMDMLKSVNTYLRCNNIKDEGDPVFLVVTHSLLQQGVYYGYNLCSVKTIGSMECVVPDGKEGQFLQII